MKELKERLIRPSQETNDRLEAAGLLPIKTAMPVGDLLRRQGVTYAHLAQVFSLAPLEKDVCEEVETMVRYEGYIQKQLDQVAHVERLEAKLLPESIDYADVPSLRDEAREKLAAIRPHSVGQASRISGVSPADVSVLLVYLEQRRRMRQGERGGETRV